MAKYILAIDQGTTGTTVQLLDPSGHVISRFSQEFPQIFPRPGWVEHDPEEIWKSVVWAIEGVLEKSQRKAHDLICIGITNQRETVVVWDRKTGQPVHNAIVWQCRRTEDFCQQLRKSRHADFIRERTGLVIDPYFSASKIRWVFKNVDGIMSKARRGELLAGTMDTYLLWKLTQGSVHKTDITNASRTMLMNIQTGQWDDELLRIFGIPKEILPEIVSSNAEFGKTSGLKMLPDGVTIQAMIGDQQAALFGQTCFEQGDAKCTFGTGSFLLLNTGKQMVVSKFNLIRTVAWRLIGDKQPTYALEGGAFICGAAVQWLRDGLKIINSSDEVEALAESVADCGGVEFVPALTGLGAPYWAAQARGLISGITRGTTAAHIARATLEALALQNTELLHCMQKDLGKSIKSVKVDGGASENNLLMQLQADFLGCDVVRPRQIETTSLGAAYLAGLGAGVWADRKAIQRIWTIEKTFKCQSTAAQRKKRLQLYRDQVQLSL